MKLFIETGPNVIVSCFNFFGEKNRRKRSNWKLLFFQERMREFLGNNLSTYLICWYLIWTNCRESYIDWDMTWKNVYKWEASCISTMHWAARYRSLSSRSRCLVFGVTECVATWQSHIRWDIAWKGVFTSKKHFPSYRPNPNRKSL